MNDGRQPREVEREILRARAEALARPLEVAEDRSGDLEFATFAVDDDRFALEASFVREVALLPEITPLPGKARVLVGIAALRGEILPVAALNRVFAGVAALVPAATHLVVLGRGRAEVGVLATAIGEVSALDVRALSAAGRERKLSRGVTRDGLVVLDAVALLSDPRLFVEDEADS